MKHYPAYKDSRIQWIGKIPSHWDVVRSRFIFDVISGNGFSDKFQGRQEGDLPFYKCSDINSQAVYAEQANNYVTFKDVKTNRWSIIPLNSILLAKIGEALKKNHRKINKSECLVDNNMMALVLKDGSEMHVKYYYYLMCLMRMEWFVNPGAVPSVDVSKFRSSVLPRLKKDEQVHIITFVDRKTTQIDDLIAKKERMIELLKEERAAIINQMVTKGLTPSFMFDTNAFDRLLNEPVDSVQAEIFITHIQKDQVAAIPKEKAEKKHHLLALFKTVNANSIPTIVAVWGVSKWDECCWGSDENNALYQEVAKRNGAEDALIAVTAIDKYLILVTDDKSLLHDVNNHGGRAITFDKFKQGNFIEMKDSGIEWLGKIPKHWEIKKLKFNAAVQFSNVDKKSDESEKPVRLCNYVDVYYNDCITPDLNFMEATASSEEINKFHLKTGDVLLTKDSEEWNDIAIPAYMTFEAPDLICGYHLAQVRPQEKVLLGKYLFWLLSADSINHQFQIEASGVTRYGLSNYALCNSTCLLSPKKEQEAIATFLDKKTAQIDVQIAREKKSIELLKEYRTSLISEVVTGKIDVRETVKC